MVDSEEDASQVGLMFRKDSGKLVEEVNKALKDMKADGTTQKFLKNGLVKMFLLSNIFQDPER